jgi:ATP-dependent Zn protease
LAKQVITKHGLSKQDGFIDHTQFDTSISEIKSEVKVWIEESHQRVSKLLDERWPAVELLAEAVLKYRVLIASEVDALLSNDQLALTT